MAKNAVAWYKGMTPSMGKLAWGPEAWKHSVGTLTLPGVCTMPSPTPLAPTSVLGTSAHRHSLAAGADHEQDPCRCCWESGPSLVLNLNCISVRQTFLRTFDSQVPCLIGCDGTVPGVQYALRQGPRLRKG